MYRLEETTDDAGNLIGVRILAGEQIVAALNGGLSILVTTVHASLGRDLAAKLRQDAFLFGIVTALNHCTLTGSIPAVTDGRAAID